MREFVVDLRKRLRGVWNDEALAEHGEHTNKLAKYHDWKVPSPGLSAQQCGCRSFHKSCKSSLDGSSSETRVCSWRALFCP
eukprot:282828-Pelagomonas_calceolata.AAC.1